MGGWEASSGPLLRAFFAVMYYAALRPEEAAVLSKEKLQPPESGWDQLLLSESAPIAGGSWTDSGERRDLRQLKQREVRHVPPPLARILRDHVTRRSPRRSTPHHSRGGRMTSGMRACPSG